MERIEALRKLAAKVEAGEDVCARDASRIWPNGYAHAVNAGCGSLDAAKALHEAVLHVDNWHVTSSGTVIIDGKRETHLVKWEEGHSPARAWLLAIIKALIAQESDATDQTP